MKKLGVLTSGGDAPGMNAAIRAVVKAAHHYGAEVMGIQGGYQGLIDGTMYPLTLSGVENISNKGGTILQTSRSLEFMEDAGRMKAVRTLRECEIDAVVVIGGEGSLKGAQKLHQLGVKIAGIPGTIDNDMPYTDYSIGFDTTLNTVLDCVGKIKDTGFSHSKTTIVEVMGRYCGDLALYSALAGEGEIISTPERKLDFETICRQLQERISSGKKDNVVIITERMYDLPSLQQYIEEKLQIEVRTMILGFIQRGGDPSAFDRVLANKLGVKAVELLIQGQSGQAVGMKENKIICKDIETIDQASINKRDDYQLLEMLLQ
ncbi:6-phosphofructokinase [Domibacillus sp. DTU_2020_1001157_1_SI_ALB_TIR_016]|uniref:6-phosphofructokinase n=1 Tax=Domibacillus sp. DTU_2020_1001157_1_SI_ALB_TIR_016 TaxID=3077789 RepID=UPI0028E2E1EA|nr:6-phosphofructokinase [Domibacillus sp. DTU_2020_1001157_1_SI_ALB_TIR_016]WNS78100.1 6-phosphofructokinase [Domibacillus sp. DTU_2020_1001157_1_SI_ALB_TIR_016]